MIENQESGSPNPDQQCARDQHVWPATWVKGDTCNCGAFYLFTDGAMHWLHYSQEQPDEKRAIDDGNGQTGVYTFDEALAEIQRLGKRCDDLYALHE